MKNKTVLKRTVALLLAVVMLFGLTACGGKDEEETTEPTTAAVTTTEPAVDTSKINKLTGLATLSKAAYGKRPVAIMINNVRAALPQYGISKADLMFEVIVEGGITRMMAVFGDYTKVPNVCSVRSCRYYFPILAYGLDAVYICFGSNKTFGTPTLKRLGIDYFDGAANYITDLFGRDSARLKKYSSEHTAYVKGENIPKVLESKKIRTDYSEGKNVPIFNFREEGKAVAAGDTNCDKVRLNFSPSYFSTFTYDTEKKVYLKQHNGSVHKDSVSGEQLNYTNVFVLETKVTPHSDNYLMKVELKGGNGYYISMGKSQKITWTKAAEGDNIQVFDSTGAPLQVNPGQSYIGIIAPNSTKITGQNPETTAASTTAAK